MDTKNRIIALAVLLTISFSVAARISQAQAETPAAEIRVTAGTKTQVEDTEWAVSRFEAVGISLPALTVVFHDNYEACGMRQGVLFISAESAEIHECMPDRDGRRHSLLHELTHAWDYLADGIDTATKQRFMELRGVTAWHDTDIDWNQRGEEQAAEIVAWGLMDHLTPIPTSLDGYGPQDTNNLTKAFQTIIGTAPLFETKTATAAPAGVTLHNSTPDLADRVEDALERFADAGLELPTLDITFHDGRDGCHGYNGYYEPAATHGEIDVCMPTLHIILHELAHAWALHAVSDGTRAEVLRYWGLATWNDQGAEWDERGGEKVAETIAFALNNPSPTPSDSLLKFLCSYPLTTGNPLPETVSVNCEPGAEA